MKTPSDIEKYLENARPKPLTKEEKQTLWVKILSVISSASDRAPRRERAAWYLPTIGFRAAFAVLLAVVIVGGGNAALAAAHNAVPGDLLFPVELASEKIQLLFSSGAKKTELKIKFAEKRFDEAQKVVTKISITDTSNNTASSTQAAGTSTPPTPNPKGLEKAKVALSQALERLEATKNELESDGNTNAALAVDRIIDRLTNLADEHLANLDKIKATISDDDKKLKIEISASSDEIKNKFKSENKSGKKDKVKIKIETENNEDEEEEDENEEEVENSGHGRGDKKATICHIPPGNHGNSQTLVIAEPAVKAHLEHGDKLGACSGGGGGNATTTPDATAPLISQIASSNVASTSATISWATNELASSKAYYATSSPLNISSALNILNASLVLNHVLNLTGLTASTTYYFIVESKDAANNTATSTEQIFETIL